MVTTAPPNPQSVGIQQAPVPQLQPQLQPQQNMPMIPYQPNPMGYGSGPEYARIYILFTQ